MTPDVAVQVRLTQAREALWRGWMRLSNARLSHALGHAGEALAVFEGRTLYTSELQTIDSTIALLCCCIEAAKEARFNALHGPATALLKRAVRLRMVPVTGEPA